MAIGDNDWKPDTGQVLLRKALEEFDWDEVERLCDSLIQYARGLADPYPADKAKETLTLLRDYRRFRELKTVGAFLLETGQRALVVQKLYAQALIDLDEFPAAEAVVKGLKADAKGKDSEQHQEAHGLLGRLYKQRYVYGAAKNIARTDDLVRATEFYLGEYQGNRDNVYLGVNALALLVRAKNDNVRIPDAPDPKKIAKALIKKVEAKGRSADYWDCASAMEASLALGDPEVTHLWLSRAVKGLVNSPPGKPKTTKKTARKKKGSVSIDARARQRLANASAFAIAGTIRQLQQIWRLDPGKPPGADIIRGLWSALLCTNGGVDVQLTAAELAATAGAAYEAAFNQDRWVPIKWFKLGAQCALSVVRIRNKRTDELQGTGFIVHGRALHPRLPDEPVLVTNSHVISARDDVHNHPDYHPLWASQVEVVLDASGGTVAPEVSVLWESPPKLEDTTILRFKTPLAVEHRVDYEVHARQLPQGGGTRIYAMGYPRGAALSFSFHNSRLLEMNKQYLRYRTPTEHGSSGSPLFDNDWRLVGVHHFSSKELPSLRNPAEKYPGNQGVWIGRIRQALDERRDLDVSGRDSPPA
jgi:hypothetical protein